MRNIEGIYRSGRVEFAEMLGDIPDETRVLVTFPDSIDIDLNEVIACCQNRTPAVGGRVAQARANG